MIQLSWNAVEALLSGTMLIVTAVPVLRVAAKRPIRRELAAHPLLGMLGFGAVLAVLVVVAWLAVESVPVRRAIVALAAVAAMAAWMHARPAFGAHRGLPPGSLGLATSLDAVDDPAFYARAAERFGPVFKMRQVHRPVVCVTDLALANELLQREHSSLGQSEWAFNRLVPGGYLEFMEGASHAHYRRLFAAAFTAEVADAAREAIAATSHDQIAAMARSAGPAGVHPEPFLYEVPFVALLHAVLGVTLEHPRVPALRAGFAAITVPLELHLPVPPSIAHGQADLVGIVRDLAATAGNSSTPSVLRNLVRQDAALASDSTIPGNLVLMVKEGSIMVRGLLRWVLKAIAADRSYTRALREADGNPGELEALSVAFVRETLRVLENRYTYRTARRDVMIGSYRIPKGWLLRVCIDEGHQDQRHFSDPQRFDPSRFLHERPGADRYCPFGHGAHACLGEELTLAIASGFVREAALRWDIRTVSDGPKWRINRHWGLWRPSPEFRVALERRAEMAHVG